MRQGHQTETGPPRTKLVTAQIFHFRYFDARCNYYSPLMRCKCHQFLQYSILQEREIDLKNINALTLVSIIYWEQYKIDISQYSRSQTVGQFYNDKTTWDKFTSLREKKSSLGQKFLGKNLLTVCNHQTSGNNSTSPRYSKNIQYLANNQDQIVGPIVVRYST